MAVIADRNKCIYCGGCVSVCPANALTLKEVRIECDAKKCVDCGSCIKFCPAGALSKK
ncbi:MAG: 4Fe-4S binding protein [archaeon]